MRDFLGATKLVGTVLKLMNLLDSNSMFLTFYNYEKISTSLTTIIITIKFNISAALKSICPTYIQVPFEGRKKKLKTLGRVTDICKHLTWLLGTKHVIGWSSKCS